MRGPVPQQSSAAVLATEGDGGLTLMQVVDAVGLRHGSFKIRHR